ncbi:MAG: hypothetical protein BZY88_19870 [SAR202 cluster bacterium Io17-Chloro-G9]|nr:MAG: hypothetical protein BZY88_19870 [SAR202 cluster bacterium Io17-Chloro-G9]
MFRVHGIIASHLSMPWVLTLSMVTVVALVILVVTLVDIRREHSLARDGLAQQGAALAQTLDDVLADAVYFSDVDRIDDIVTTIAEGRTDLSHIRIYRPDGSLLADSAQSDHDVLAQAADQIPTTEFGSEPSLVFTGYNLAVKSVITAGPQVIGLVHAEFNAGPFQAEINRIILEHTLQGLILTALAMVLSFALARYATRPLRTLASAASDMGGGNLDMPVPVQGPKEIRELGVSLERMRAELGDLYSNLEDQVARRTEELTKTAQGLENEIVERQLAQENLSQRNQELEALINVSAVMVHESTFRDKCDAIMESLVRIVPADLATLRVLDSTGESLELEAAAGEHRLNRPMALPLRQGLTALALSSQEALVVNEYDLHPSADPGAVAQGFKSGVFLPIKDGRDKTLGVIDVVSLHRDHFTPQRVKLLTAIVDGLGSLLNTDNLSHELQASVEELALVDEVSRIITSTLDIGLAYPQFSSQMDKLMDFDCMNINVVDRESGTLIIKCHVGPNPPGTHAGVTRDLVGTQTESVVLCGQTIIRDDISQDRRFTTDENYLSIDLKSVIMTPLASNGQVVGTLALRSKKAGAYGSREKAILERVAGQIAPAVENSLLFDQVRQLAQALEGIGDAVIFSDLKGNIRFTNHAFEDIFGYTAEDVLGCPVNEIIPGVKPSLDTGWGNAEAPILGAWRGESTQFRKDGEEFHVNLTVTEVKAVAGNAIGVIVVAQDVTPRIVAEEERMELEMRALAQSKLATLGEVATGVAHEINQPLTYINTMIQAFQEDLSLNDLDHEQMSRRLSESRRQVDRITNIVEHLRIFGRTDNSEMEPLNLEKVLDNTMLLLKERIMARNIDLSLRVDAGLPLVTGNASQLEQVFINLFQNSLDALAERHDDAQIRVTLSPVNDGTTADMMFFDNGVGIAPDVLPKIYDPFFTTKGVGQGTGLGLSIAYGIVRDHRGTITCESTQGEGTTVTIRLPSEGVPHVNP